MNPVRFTPPHSFKESSHSLMHLSVIVVMIVRRLFYNGSTNSKIQPNSRHRQYSLRTRPRQNYNHCVMLGLQLNDCVSACWSPKFQSLALISLADSHPLVTSCKSARHYKVIGNSSSHFCISISVLQFQTQAFLPALRRYV